MRRESVTHLSSWVFHLSARGSLGWGGAHPVNCVQTTGQERD